MANKEKKPKKIVFSEEIDSALEGYALSLIFIGIGLFLLLKPDYFAEPIASYIVGAAVGLFGVMGMGVELSKTAKIKGIDMLSIGAALFAVWLLQYVYIHTLWANIVFFAFLVFGAYGVFLGLFRAVYSIFYNAKTNSNNGNGQPKSFSIGKALSQTVIFLTQLCSLVIAIINVLKATGM